MRDEFKFNRRELAKFLPNHEAIVNFEKIAKFVSVTAPNDMEEILALVSGVRAPSTARLENAITDLQALISTVRSQSSAVAQLASQVQDLQMAINQRPNLSRLLQRIENLEKLTGV